MRAFATKRRAAPVARASTLILRHARRCRRARSTRPGRSRANSAESSGEAARAEPLLSRPCDSFRAHHRLWRCRPGGDFPGALLVAHGACEYRRDAVIRATARCGHEARSREPEANDLRWRRVGSGLILPGEV